LSKKSLKSQLELEEEEPSSLLDLNLDPPPICHHGAQWVLRIFVVDCVWQQVEKVSAAFPHKKNNEDVLYTTHPVVQVLVLLEFLEVVGGWVFL
jgi:hypothetical protein